jgi:hypothetical protein
LSIRVSGAGPGTLVLSAGSGSGAPVGVAGVIGSFFTVVEVAIIITF